MVGGRRFFVIIMLSCILLQSTLSSKAILPSGDLLYSNFLVVGKELEWQVSVLDWSGNKSIYSKAYIDHT